MSTAQKHCPRCDFPLDVTDISCCPSCSHEWEPAASELRSNETHTCYGTSIKVRFIDQRHNASGADSRFPVKHADLQMGNSGIGGMTAARLRMIGEWLVRISKEAEKYGIEELPPLEGSITEVSTPE